ncbi:MAG: helix-turn-helix domain-containing protein [Eggerthellaceae bacterium]
MPSASSGWSSGYPKNASGRMVGTNQTYISLLEAGEINVTFNKLCRIAEALEVEVSDLVR